MNITLDKPLCMLTPQTLYATENDFCQALLDDDLFWVAIGCKPSPEYRRHTTPDFLAFTNDMTGTRFGVEAERDTAAFDAHGHDPYRIHLIITIQAPWHKRVHKGISVVSLYRRCPDRWCRLSLEDDVKHLFNGRKHHDWSQYE